MTKTMRKRNPTLRNLTSGIRKGKKCKLKTSDETGKFCNHHKKQT